MRPLVVPLIGLLAASGSVSVAPSLAAQSIDNRCDAITASLLRQSAQIAANRASLSGGPSVLAGGAWVDVWIAVPPPEDHVVCGRFVDVNRAVRVISVAPGTDEHAGTTAVTLEIPELGFGPIRTTDLILMSFGQNADGSLVTASPGLSVVQEVQVSNHWFAAAGAVVAVAIAYLLAVLAVGRVRGKWSFDPVRLTVGVSGRASLSQFQILGFTLLVIGLLVYVLLRTSVLSDISSDVLLLLGISAGGTAGSKLAGSMKKRISFENWSWLRENGWLTTYEKGVGGEEPKSSWSDLLKTDGQFDVYSFQLATVSAIVALGLLTSDLTQLAKFEIPPNLLALLGLSNVVFIGGKAVTPNSIGELDEKVTAVRDAEREWRQASASAVVAEANPQKKLDVAKSAAADNYQSYVGLAREAARMLKAVYKDGTKFGETIAEADLLPSFEG